MSIYDSGNCGDKLCESLGGHYEILRLPFRKTVRQLTPVEAKNYYEWFLCEIPTRLRIFLGAVESEDQSTYKQLDYTPQSLLPLGHWLPKHVHMLKRDPLELQREIEKLPSSYRVLADQLIDEHRWSSETVSLCYDIGIYFAKVFQLRFENVKWTYLTEPKDWVDVNKPVLEGFRVHMSPYDIVLVSAGKMLRKKEGAEKELKRLYDFWTTEHILPGQTTGVYVRGKDKWTPD